MRKWKRQTLASPARVWNAVSRRCPTLRPPRPDSGPERVVLCLRVMSLCRRTRSDHEGNSSGRRPDMVYYVFDVPSAQTPFKVQVTVSLHEQPFHQRGRVYFGYRPYPVFDGPARLNVRLVLTTSGKSSYYVDSICSRHDPSTVAAYSGGVYG